MGYELKRAPGRGVCKDQKNRVGERSQVLLLTTDQESESDGDQGQCIFDHKEEGGSSCRKVSIWRAEENQNRRMGNQKSHRRAISLIQHKLERPGEPCPSRVPLKEGP